MSNERMDVPSNPLDGWDRIELVVYLDHALVTEEPDYIDFFGDVLLYYAKVPFLLDDYLAPEKVVPVITLGSGRCAFFGDPSIAAFILIPPPLELPESGLHEHLKLDGDRVDLLALVPIPVPTAEPSEKADCGPGKAKAESGSEKKPARCKPRRRRRRD